MGVKRVALAGYYGRGNFGDDLMKIKQVQKGQWKTVWPESHAAPGAKFQR